MQKVENKSKSILEKLPSTFKEFIIKNNIPADYFDKSQIIDSLPRYIRVSEKFKNEVNLEKI